MQVIGTQGSIGFGHVYCISVDAVGKRSDMVIVDGSTMLKGAVVWKDLGFLEIMEHDALNKTQWKQQIHIADSNLIESNGLVWFVGK